LLATVTFKIFHSPIPKDDLHSLVQHNTTHSSLWLAYHRIIPMVAALRMDQ
jgi:hypothetical protein